jgi:hypothetical protein
MADHPVDPPIDPQVTFEQAIDLAQKFLNSPDPPEQLQAKVTELLQTDNGARGFFVSLLTGDSPFADHPIPAILNGLKTSPERVAELLTKNLAMATAMEITHLRQESPDQAAGSARVKQRTLQLIRQLQAEMPTLNECLQELATSLTSPDTGKYQSFLQRWGYDLEQRKAIQTVIDEVK